MAAPAAATRTRGRRTTADAAGDAPASSYARTPDAPRPVGPRLNPGQLFQVQDTTGTWHAAAVGPGVLCNVVRAAARTSNNQTEGFDPLTTVAWDYGADQVDCPETECRYANGRR